MLQEIIKMEKPFYSKTIHKFLHEITSVNVVPENYKVSMATLSQLLAENDDPKIAVVGGRLSAKQITL